MYRKIEAGVTLTELAVVIAIIGLLLASVLGGANLMQAARVKKLLTEFESIKIALDEFKAQYDYLPGDLHTASSFWSGAPIGDGNTVVGGSTDTEGDPQEDLGVWNHLANAEFIRGSYAGAPESSSARYAIGDNAYVSEAYDTGVFSFMQTPASISYYGTTGMALSLGTVINNSGTKEGVPLGGVVSARDAYAIDAKTDDGTASKGKFFTVRRYPVTGETDDDFTTCVTAKHSASSAAYQLDDETQECHLLYWYQKD